VVDFFQGWNCYERQQDYDRDEDHQFEERESPFSFLKPLHGAIRFNRQGTGKVIRG
jgi:hypothetical protein